VRLPPPRLQESDPRELLESIAVLLRPACTERGITRRWEVEGEPPAPVPMDRAQMEQAFVNVCKNALEAVGRDGTLTVRLGRRGGRGYVCIEDSGAGIPDSVRAHAVHGPVPSRLEAHSEPGGGPERAPRQVHAHGGEQRRPARQLPIQPLPDVVVRAGLPVGELLFPVQEEASLLVADAHTHADVEVGPDAREEIQRVHADLEVFVL
jgi:hypothetical protein